MAEATTSSAKISPHCSNGLFESPLASVLVIFHKYTFSLIWKMPNSGKCNIWVALSVSVFSLDIFQKYAIFHNMENIEMWKTP
jgi:hypothetical protein